MRTLFFTTYYDEPNRDRAAELDLCLHLNSDAFDLTYVISEVQNYREPKPFGIYGKRRPGRQTFANLLAEVDCACGDDIVVIANCDIIIPDSSLQMMAGNLKPGEVYCLTRWDIMGSGIRLYDSASSQDAWVFRGPPKQNIGGEYFFGHPGVDNRFAAELNDAGYRVLNPSRDIRTYHLHLTGHRPNNKPENRVPLPYLFVAPHRLGEEPIYKRPTRASRRASAFQK